MLHVSSDEILDHALVGSHYSLLEGIGRGLLELPW
jgi:hypothetical protein